MTPAQLVVAALLVPTCGAALVAATGRWPNLRETVTLVSAALLLACVAAILPAVLAGARPAVVLTEMLPGLSIALRVEPLGMLFALIASGLWIVNSLYSIGYMRGNDEAHQTRFYVCFALALAATMGIALAGNMFTLFVFYELLTLVTYPLVTHSGSAEARRGGRTYLGVLMGTSIMFLLPALVITWAVAGTTDFAAGGILAGRLDPLSLGGLLALYVFGIAKAAVMPFHRWLPAAMVAPTPVSALLHAVAVVKAGVFTVVKVIVYVFGIAALREAGAAHWLVAIAGFTIIAASLVALNARNLKRMLAYSTVSQLSYIVMAAALLAPLSIIGAVMHIAAHALGKITLFFAAGAIYTACRQDRGRRARRHRPAHALDARRVRGRRDLDDRPAAGGRLHLQVVHAVGRDGDLERLRDRRDRRQHPAQRRLFPADRLPCLLPRRPRTARRATAKRRWPMVVALSATAAATVLLFLLPGVALLLARQLSQAQAERWTRPPGSTSRAT